MSTQLRLVGDKEPARRPASPRRARVTKAPRARRTHWADDWRLDDGTRRAGRDGVAAARAALAAAHGSDSSVRRAS
ncbi:MAG: hypothetical protein WEC34_11165 [Acidimicrobiia bacterium]